jgi:DNA invertase Pin-like site-specific DNA recombinase
MADPVRCAIYTRKSTEEGLEQEFNSLDAQREACAAYILSQRHEGWSANPQIYDDGGYSGGNMQRPGLVQLMADVAAGKVNVIVVYKVDRLTSCSRSPSSNANSRASASATRLRPRSARACGWEGQSRLATMS